MAPFLKIVAEPWMPGAPVLLAPSQPNRDCRSFAVLLHRGRARKKFRSPDSCNELVQAALRFPETLLAAWRTGMPRRFMPKLSIVRRGDWAEDFHIDLLANAPARH